MVTKSKNKIIRHCLFTRMEHFPCSCPDSFSTRRLLWRNTAGGFRKKRVAEPSFAVSFGYYSDSLHVPHLQKKIASECQVENNHQTLQAF